MLTGWLRCCPTLSLSTLVVGLIIPVRGAAGREPGAQALLNDWRWPVTWVLARWPSQWPWGLRPWLLLCRWWCWLPGAALSEHSKIRGQLRLA